MLHKDVSTGNVVKCEVPNLCRISNLHAESHKGLSKLYADSEKKLAKVDSLKIVDVQFILERKTLENELLISTIQKMERDIDKFSVTGEVNPAFLKSLNTKLERMREDLSKIEEAIILLEVRKEELAK